jgi:uncharacterized repeat protein (TIGR01451 family)
MNKEDLKLKHQQSNISRKMLFCLILFFLGLMSASVTHAENYTFVTKWYGNSYGQFNTPQGIAVDSLGNVYVADMDNNRIQKFNRSGIFLTSFGSFGNGDGQFNHPSGIAVDSSGNVYVADLDNDRIQKFSSNSIFLTKWGSEGSGDGQFNDPYGVAIDSSGNVYVADKGNNRIQKFDSSGGYLAEWGYWGSDGDGQFNHPSGIAVDSSGNVYVADLDNDRIQKFSSDGIFLAKWGYEGSGNGQFDNPSGIAVDSLGNVYVSDTYNDRIQKFSSNGIFLTKWGYEGSGDGQFNDPSGIAVDSSGNVYVADTSNNRIQKFSSNGKFIKKWGSWGDGNGQFSDPCGVAVDSLGNVYVADMDNNRILKFSSNGNPITQWSSWDSGDVQFNYPYGIAVDSSSNIYVVDRGNNRILKFNSNCEYLTQWGSYGSGDGQFNDPEGIAVDSSGNVYVADRSNYRIQKFNSSGGFIKKWGSWGDGNGQFNNPSGIAVDSLGNVYVADTYNDRIQKFNSSGTFLTKWGYEGSGDGQFNDPSGIAVDSLGNVYVADTYNDRIQKFNSIGGYLTKWGSYGSGDAQFDSPWGVAVDTTGIVYVADTGNNRIQMFMTSSPVQEGTNLFLSLGAPESKNHGSSMTYTLYYFNFGNVSAHDVVLENRLPADVTFESASDGGAYDPSTRTVRWNIGSVNSTGHGYSTLSVNIPQEIPAENVIVNNADISTSDLEVQYDDNKAQAQTKVTGLNLPLNVSIEPNNGGIGTPSVDMQKPITFSYHSDKPVAAVNIRIHVDDGGPDIIDNMTAATTSSKDTTMDSISATTDSTTGYASDWTYTVTLDPRHGKAMVTFSRVTLEGVEVKTFALYIDPAGYIYDVDTGARIAGASVWLQHPDGKGDWENVTTGQNPPVSQPDINPLTTDQNGMYQWDVLEGSYRVHVEAPGYEAADSIVVSIPPPVTDLHVGLHHINDPNVPPILPVANFSTDVSSGYAPLSVQFTDLFENATGWSWDFGDGAISADRYPIHTYSTTGLYTVNLTVSNANGKDSKLATISVFAQPAIIVFPGYTNPPTDLDQDGLYEDINGNGRLDFDDVVAYYDNMDWIEENVPLALFDYNNNEVVDFDDVVKLYDML